MLVLSRRLGQKIVIPAIQTTLQIATIKPGVVRVGIDAPETIAVYREELLERSDFQAESASHSMLLENTVRELIHLLNHRLHAGTVGLALLRRQLERGLTSDMLDTLDKIESHLTNIQQRVEKLDANRPHPARAAKGCALVVEDDRNECELLGQL